ncbi:MAG: VWA domain-containing protein [Deltaproteobacteria bacterium]|nr:VWA domain-containing protein [Deltaproteobacteria bacterium]
MTIFAFFRQARAAAGIVGVFVTLMTLGGAALVTDHLWLTYHRDLLKNAADAAVMAATSRLQELPSSMSDDDVSSRLQPVAERYVRFNLAGNLSEKGRAQMDETLKVDLELNRRLGTVAVLASADMGGTLLSKRVLAYAGSKDGVAVKSGADSSVGATELVLAIDVTGSMSHDLQGESVDGSDPTSRISIVREAAEDLIDILASHENSTIAVGIVPWDYRVRLNRDARTRWEAEGWAVYPAARTYPHPTRTPPGRDKYLPERQSMPARNRLPNACRAWAGCLDMRVVDSALRPSFSTTLPSAEPFRMSFFTDQTTYPEDQYVSYACQAYTRAESNGRGGEEPLCYDLDSAPTGQNLCEGNDIQADGPWRVEPQDDCNLKQSEIMPLNSDLDAVRTAIRGLKAGGSATYSSVGIAWAIRLLAPSWRDVWGDPVHPMDQDSGAQKVIVLLTDGEDNHLTDSQAHRRQGCTAAKNEGIIIFTIAAMNADDVGTELSRGLRECSSAADDPDGTYVFVNNADPDALRKAFADIGRQIASLRRMY